MKLPFVLILIASFVDAAYGLDYVGCFIDAHWQKIFPYLEYIPGPWPLSTIEECQIICVKKTNFTYTGLHAKYQCFCGEDYSRYGQVNETECNMNCDSNSTLKCGGAYRMSVYHTCARGRYGKDCSNSCSCKDSGFCLRNGTCLAGECDPGWIGSTCSDDIDECLQSPCSHECVNTPGSYRCACRHGYTLDNNNYTCLDIDECEQKMCKQKCMNTEGSYHCACYNGYTLDYTGDCCVDLWRVCSIVLICLIILTGIGFVIFKCVRRRKVAKKKEENICKSPTKEIVYENAGISAKAQQPNLKAQESDIIEIPPQQLKRKTCEKISSPSRNAADGTSGIQHYSNEIKLTNQLNTSDSLIEEFINEYESLNRTSDSNDIHQTDLYTALNPPE